ncbi:MAG: response regulator [Myxococcota bacterium]
MADRTLDATQTLAEKILSDPCFRLLSSLSDDLRSPLAVILGQAEQLADSKLDSAQQGAVESIESHARRLLESVSDLLALVALAADEGEAEPLALSPGSVLERAVARARERANERALLFALVIEPSVPERLWIDGPRLEQIVRHLADNAVKFTASGSVIVRADFEPPDRLRIEVADTGPGLSRAEFERLSEPLALGEDALGRRQRGAGLGLALATRLAKVLGARIECSGGPGRGTRISVDLRAPLVVERESDALARPDPSGTILVVDDGADNRRLLARILELDGMRVATACDGRQGVARALEGDIDLVVMDIQMPVLDGYEATRELRRAGFRSPVLALTANTAPQVRDLCLAAGCDGVLSKPIARETLRKEARRLLARVQRPDPGASQKSV